MVLLLPPTGCVRVWHRPMFAGWMYQIRFRPGLFLAIKSDIWWQQFWRFSRKATNQILCSLKTTTQICYTSLTTKSQLSHAWHCKCFDTVNALTLFVGRQERRPACKKLVVGLLMIWLELCMSYGFSCYHHFPSSSLQ